MKNLSLSQKFWALLGLFSAITMAVLFLLVQEKNEPINFAQLEMAGNAYQRPIEKILHGVFDHRIHFIRKAVGDKSLSGSMGDIEKNVDLAFSELEKVDKELGDSLKFTDEGLRARKREQARFALVAKRWKEIKDKQESMKFQEFSDAHTQLIADLRLMITHLGDTSNLILDPDLDTYYLVDLTLSTLPQSQDRMQSAFLDLLPMVARGSATTEDRLKASVFAAMMSESDLDRAKGDLVTVFNENGNFSPKSETLTSNLTPKSEKFHADYQALIEMVKAMGEGKVPNQEQFVRVSSAALTSNFDYWTAGSTELDRMFESRIHKASTSKVWATVLSILCLLFSFSVAYVFMRSLTKSLKSIVAVLNTSSDEVFSASASSSSSSTELSEAATEQAASLQETMASVEEISAMVNQNTDSAHKTKAAMDTNLLDVTSGSKSVDDMLSAIGEIAETNGEILSQMEASNKEFGEIVKIISEIGEKTNVINEIVFQTKLLSFNASVEAARAGEHGKGFAVVAEEVGNLAQMSGNSAKEITDMLSESMKRVNSIVENTRARVDRLVEIGKDKISMGQSTSQKCREALNRISENARSAMNMVSEISNASKEQAQGIQEINKAISQLDQVTQQNSAVAQQGSTQAEQLAAEAQELKSAVIQLTHFVDGQSRGSAAHHAPTPQRAAAHANPANVTALHPHKKAKVASPTKSRPLKKASGETVPDAANPGFEEF